jgi:hypothetical protein
MPQAGLRAKPTRRTNHIAIVPVRTAWLMRAAAAIAGSCSQTRMTRQPAAIRSASVSRSRSTFRRSFARQYSAFALGRTPCSWQPCQKQPSTNTAIRWRENTTSARRRDRLGAGATSTRYLSPRRCSSRRSASSGAVSRFFDSTCIRRRTPAETAGGDCGTSRAMPTGLPQRPARSPGGPTTVGPRCRAAPGRSHAAPRPRTRPER